jgi:hypothetical protein
MGSGKPGPDKAFVFALVFSLITVISGISWSWRVGKSANLVAHELSHVDDGLKDLRKFVAKKEAMR